MLEALQEYFKEIFGHLPEYTFCPSLGGIGFTCHIGNAVVEFGWYNPFSQEISIRNKFFKDKKLCFTKTVDILVFQLSDPELKTKIQSIIGGE